MLTVYTAQYRYNGPDRLDITVKGQDPFGKVFAPTWDIVMDLKGKRITEKQYTEEYYKLMKRSWHEHNWHWQQLWDTPQVTLVCVCPAGTFCHRLVLAAMLKEMGATYLGERVL